jgi:hypothetical protein
MSKKRKPKKGLRKGILRRLPEQSGEGGDFKLADSAEYEIQGEFYRNLGK